MESIVIDEEKKPICSAVNNPNCNKEQPTNTL